MDGPVNPGVAAAFIAEALSYLPKILEALEVNGPDLPAGDASEHTSLEEAHRLVHTIGGAAAIVGFPTVSDRAKTVELELETLVSTGAALDPDAARRLQFMVCEIGAEVDKIAAESLPPGDFADDGWGEPTGAAGDEVVADDSFEVIGATGLDDESALVGDDSFGDEPFGEEDNHPPAAAAAADAPFQLPVDDVVPPELMDVFVVEAADHLQTIARTLSALHGNPQDRATLQELRRSVHTLKGAAGMVGFRTVSQLAHRMEDLLDALYDGDIPSTQDTTAVLFAGADVLHHLVTGEGNQEEIRQGIPALYARLTAALKDDAAHAVAPPAPEAPLPAPARPSQTASSTKSSTANYALPPDPDRVIAKPTRTVGPKGSSGVRRTKARQHVRVAVDRLDELINLVGEMVINRSAFQQYLQNISRELQELGQSVGRLRLLWSKLETEYELGTPMGRTARRAAITAANDLGRPSAAETHGFDELEFDQYTESHLLSRQLSETVGDIDAVSHQLHESITSFEGDFSRMKRLTTDAQDRLLRLRMVPIGTQATKLERVVRMTAESRNKHVDFTLEGESVALDRPILDEVSDALLHLLRNAVDHGVEGPEDRVRVGKHERAKVAVRASYEGAHAIIQVTDDGRGLNFERMRDVAVRDGFLLPEDAAAMTERELQMLIFRPKFSTAQEISEVSGRGVGLDVVKEKIQQLNGTVSVASKPGHGATFTLRLPLTLAVARVLLVKAGGQTFALPAPTITRVLRVDREDVERDGEVREVALEGVQYPATHVLKALGAEERQEDKSSRVSALILASQDNPAALIVDQFLEARDVVVTMLTGHLRRVRGLAGATVLGDGQVVVILNPDELLSQAQTQRTGAAAVRQMPAPIDQHARTLRILVVDDSLSVRQVLANLVRRVGWTPLVARDGLEALETLQREPMLPDLIFSDVEMPRMDGYELTSTVKADPKMKRVPVVFITSRAGDKHRRRGFEVGAAGYLVKPFDEQALLTLVARLTGVQPDHGLATETGGSSSSASDVTGEQVS